MQALQRKGIVLVSVLLIIVALSIIILNPSFISIIQEMVSGKKLPGSCKVVEQQYCNTAKILPYKVGTSTFIAFKIPAGAPIFAPMSGQIMKDLRKFGPPSDRSSSNRIYPGIIIDNATNSSSQSAQIDQQISLHYYGAPMTASGQNISSEAILGNATSQTISYFGDYNVIVSYSLTKSLNGKVLVANAHDAYIFFNLK